MPNNTGNRGYTYPTLGDSNDVPFYMQTLAEQIDADVDALNDPAPVTPIYEAGWGPWGTTYQGATATRSSGGLVGVAGLIGRTGATIGSSVDTFHLLTLPIGYRPARQILVVVTGFSGGSTYPQCILDILTDGRILARWTTPNPWNTGTSWISLAGLTFVAGA